MIAVSAKPQVVRAPKTFDLAKFESMIEPFSVRIEKIKGSMKMEIPLPPSEGGGAPGTGLSKDQVREIQSWLVNEWAGGGHYNIAITDASTPPVLLEWTAYYPPHEFPEKVPPTLQGAFLPNVPSPSTPTQAKSNMATFSGSGSSLPPASLFPVQPGSPMPAPTATGYYPQPVPYSYPQLALGATGMGQSNEAAMLREQLARAREEAVQRDFERRLAEMKAENDRRTAELQQSMQAMVQQLSQAMQQATLAQQKPAVDPVLEQMREQNRVLQEQMRVQQAEMERARREAELREEIRRTQEQTAKLVEESNRRFEAMLAANVNKGPDPQFMMFQQMMAQQMETMKEMARSSQAQLDRVQNHIMRPQDILQIAKESQSGTDQVVHNISRQYESMFQLSRQLIEQAAQLNSGGGGNEVVGLVRDVGANLAEMARRYTGDKSKEQIAAVNAQAEIAKAQAEVQKAQLDQVARMAAMEAAIKSGTAVSMPNGVYAAPGAPMQATITAPNVNPARPWQPAAGGGLSGAPTNVVPIKPDDGQRRMKGRTDLEWFGPTLPNVMQMREEVAKFIAAIGETPPRKDGAGPEEAAFMIQQAAAEIMRRQIPIPAMVDLLMQGMVADFLDVLLPDAPQAYRDDVVKLLMSGDDGDDDDDDDDDDHTAPQAS